MLLEDAAGGGDHDDDRRHGGGVDVVLRDGFTIHLRPVREADGPAMLAFLNRLSEQSRALRFFSAATDLAGQARRAVNAAADGGYALVATAGRGGEIVAHAVYVGDGGAAAEVAFAIAGTHEGRGLATVLLAHLAAHAHTHGVAAFTAVVLPENHRMIDVFRQSGFAVEVRAGFDVVSVRLSTELTPEGWARFETREETACVAAVGTVLAPRAVAVIGASRRRGTVGGEILHNLVAGGYQGIVYPVNLSGGSVQAMPAYRSVAELPERVDLAVIAVPAAGVLGVAGECGAAGVGSLLVVSAGFAETGPEGAVRQRELVEVCRGFGMRLVGPNCLGVLNTAAGVALNATFMPRSPQAGRVGFLSQSGGLGIAIVDAANRLRLGLSSFVSVGNKADLSGNDFIRYWEQDPATEVILLYLESFGNPRKFARVARRAGRTKPIAAVKSGRSPAGARATSSHTGALLAASDVTVDALFRQAGVIRADTLGELFDVAALLSSQPAPSGNRVAIITNAGGPGIMCSDACVTSGLEVAALPARLRARLRRFLPAHASLAGPVDMIATAGPEDYRRAIEAVGRAGVADAIIAIFVPALATQSGDVAAAISQAADRLPPDCSLLAVFMAEDGATVEPRRAGRPIPVYAFPEDAARALGHAARYGRWRNAAPGVVPSLGGCRPDEAAGVIARALGAGGGWLAPGAAARLLGCYGVGSPAARQGADPVAAGAGEREQGPGAGVELIVGVVPDPAFGPLVACGVGGAEAELLDDVAVRLTPLTDLDAAEMLRSLKAFPRLEGHRGAPACDLPGLEGLLLRVSALVEAHPEVAEIDLKPVLALPEGPRVLGARIRLEACAPAPGPLSLAGGGDAWSKIS